jgi:hypothetical protein
LSTNDLLAAELYTAPGHQLHWKLSKWWPLIIFGGRQKAQSRRHSSYLVRHIAAA